MESIIFYNSARKAVYPRTFLIKGAFSMKRSSAFFGVTNTSWVKIAILGCITLGAMLCADTAQARARFVLQDMFSVDGDPYHPARWVTKDNVFQVQFERWYNSDRCIGNYTVRFTFNRDYRTLRDGDEFTVKILKVGGKTPCGHKWTKAFVYDAGGPNPHHPMVPSNYVYNGNIHVTQGRPLPLWPGNPSEAYVSLKVEVKKDAPYTKISLSAGDKSLYLMYRLEDDGMPAIR
jgi:hypothetical protein